MRTGFALYGPHDTDGAHTHLTTVCRAAAANMRALDVRLLSAPSLQPDKVLDDTSLPHVGVRDANGSVKASRKHPSPRRS